MSSLGNNIITYLKYLNQDCGLSVSVHFSREKLLCFPQEFYARLRPFMVHENPYCNFVKRQHWKICMDVKQQIIHGCWTGDSQCHVCCHGVKELLFRITEADTAVGYAVVSGFREAQPHPGCKNEALWSSQLCASPVPQKRCEILIPPLCRMFELLLTFQVEEHTEDEYRLILQFLSERRGQVTLQELCDQFQRSKSYMSHSFSKKSGMSLCAYCNDLKLAYAKKVLRKPDISVTDAAMDAGFGDVSYFIMLFRRKFGITPLKYREQICSAPTEE